MKVLLDAMLSPAIARALRECGADVVALQERFDKVALSDPEVMELARVERRAVVTNNVRDYRPLHVAAIIPGGRGHYGLIFMPSRYKRTARDVGRIVAALDRILKDHPAIDALADAELWLP